MTGYTIQIGAFSEQANAKRTADALVSRTAKLRIGTPRLVASKNRFKQPVALVQIGYYATFSAAKRARQTLGNAQAIIVPLSR